MIEQTEKCYICGGIFPRAQGVYQVGRNQMKLDQWMVRSRFCCNACAKRGQRNFLVALALIGAILLGSAVYVILN